MLNKGYHSKRKAGTENPGDMGVHAIESGREVEKAVNKVKIVLDYR